MILFNKEELHKRLFEDEWNIGFISNSLEQVISSADSIHVEWMKHKYSDRWFADPFILSSSEKEITLLVEEFPYNTRIGIISLLVVDRTSYTLLNRYPILELSTHLSFPAIRRTKDKVFVYPENSQAGKLTEYEFNNKSLIYAKDLISEPLTDAIQAKIGEIEYIFSTKSPDSNGKVIDVYIRQEDHYILNQKIKFNNNISRNAGDWFDYKGDIYRPAQDCNKTYGGGIFIQKLSQLDGKFVLNNISRITLDSDQYPLGCHTLNHYEGIIVTDGHRYRYRKLIVLLKYVKRMFSWK